MLIKTNMGQSQNYGRSRRFGTVPDLKTRNLMVLLLAAILIFALLAGSEAAVTGACVNCHTMHNSQSGVAVNASGAQQFLLRVGSGTVTPCWGCHGQGTSSNILTNIPQIRHTNVTDLAGGNFNYIATVDNQGHNVIDYTANPESTLTTPPGDQNSTGVTNLNLTCAGTYGCHGNRAVAGVGPSMKGAHHTNDAMLKFGTINEVTQGTTVGNSYRFLKGVKGGEETNWMGSSPSPTVHNEYKGATTGGVSEDSTISSPGAAGAISGLCAECHGNFHGGSADLGGPTGTPWLRHPTDITLPGGTTEYAAYTAYNLTAPVARQTIPNAISGTVTPGTDVIMCLSCHRAHASPNFKMMRWDYKNATLGTAIYGCNVCHTSKN